MKPTIVLINLLLIFTGFNGIAQEIKIPKDTVYFDFINYVNNCKHSDILNKLKWQKKNGIQFNLCGKAVFIHPKNESSDTLAIKHLKNYNMTDIEDIDSLGKMWYKKNLYLLRKKYGKLIAPHDKNGKFITYIIEKFEDYFIKYRVYWRHQKP
jgi:hypothetical protein